VVAQRIHNSVVEEFGDSYLDQMSGTEASEVEVEDFPEQDAQQTVDLDAAIELQEFPWATGDIGDIKIVGPMVSGKQTHKPLPRFC